MNENVQEIIREQPSIDYKTILFKILRYWYLFVITVVLSVVIAYLINKYTRPVYEVSTTVLIKDKTENAMNPMAFIGFGFNNQQNLQNEVGILTSYALSFRTVTKTGFEVAYFKEDNFISR